VQPFHIALSAALLALACRSDSEPEPADQDAADQIARGAVVFSKSCAECHGTSGQGTDEAPPLVGAGALPLHPRPGQKRAAPFHTALDVATFVTQNMPPKAAKLPPLSEADYWAVLAFALSANGVALERPVDPDRAAAIVLHPQ
jgi:cytochrome c